LVDEIILYKRSMYAFTKNSNDPKATAHYIKYCIILRNIIEEATKLDYSRLTAKSNKKIKTTLNIIMRQGKFIQWNMFPHDL